ncbi:MAG: alpha/beta fold hydrolase [bacterium]
MNTQSRGFLPRLALLLLLSLSAAACSIPEPILPRETLFKPFTYSAPSVSPDGKHVVYAKLDNGVRNLYIRTVGINDDTPLTNLAESVDNFFWTRNSEMVVYIQSNVSGAKGFFVIDITTNETRSLLSGDQAIPEDVSLEVTGVSLERPDEIALSMNARDPSVFDLHLLNIRTGALRLIAQGKSNLLRWYVSPTLELQGYLLSEPDGGQSFWRYQNGKFKRELTWTLLDDSSWPAEFSQDGRTCLLLDSRGAPTVGLVRYNLETGDTTVLARDPNFDIRRLLIDPTDDTVEAVYIEGDTSHWLVVNEKMIPHLEFLQKKLGRKQVLIQNRSTDRSVWVVGKVSDVAPPVYYLYYANEMRLEELYSASNGLKKKSFARMKSIQFTTRDGRIIKGYLTTPRRGSGPWPTVVLVHGGPWTRDIWGFNPEVQWLANRGYAVLQVNFRGSQGYGKDFLNAGNRQWGRAMQSDLADGSAWAIESGVAKRGSIVIFGGSFGGYSAVSGAIFTPETYVAAVAVNPFLDLIDYLSTIPPTWEAYRTNLDQRVGRIPRYESGLREGQVKDSTDWNAADRSEIDQLRLVSPYYHPEKVSIPLLIVQGKRDVLARPEVTKRFVEMLKESGKNVDLVWYDDSGHWLQTKDRVDFYFRAELFLASYLGGRVEK